MTKLDVAHPAIERMRERSRWTPVAAGADHVSLRTRIAALYRLFVRAKEISLDMERTPPGRQGDAARRAWWPDGVDTDP
ncbi:MAG: hypothetical protein ACRDIC_02090 [bacterium]